MTPDTVSQIPRFEPRWPVVFSILTVLVLLVLLPRSLRLLPIWLVFVFGAGVLAPMAVLGLTASRARWARVERMITLIFTVSAVFSIIANLVNIIDAMLNRSSEISGLQLITASIAVWVTTVLIFSLLYWQIDRGGPEGRVDKSGKKPDWFFAQEGAPAGSVTSHWRPSFVDYLFLGYTTATAFSSTDTMPLTSRAKLLMMIESMISLVTVLVVAARAINILG